MKNILIDAGSLFALFDKSDKYNLKAISLLKSLERGLITTWPVITETSHMLSFSTKAQSNFLEWIERGGLKIYEMEHDQISRLSELTKKYDDVPMDLADASLIVVSEIKGIHQIVSIDSDFYIYRDINLSSTLICKFRFSYNSIDKASFRRYSELYRGKTTQYIGLYGKAFPTPPINSDFLPKNSLQ